MKSIAIDGPAGAGKSTVAKLVARELGFIYVDTGAMYRAMAYHLLCHGISGSDGEAVAAACPQIHVSIEYEDGEQQVLLNGENVNGKIRSEEVSMMTSCVSRYPAVREKLMSLQRELADTKDVIMDGRDIGTCVLPGADVKIYLTAGAAQRARRRYEEQIRRGVSCDIQDIERDIIARDEQDMNREVAPLRKAEDAVLVDTSDMTAEEAAAQIIRIYRDKAEGKRKVTVAKSAGFCFGVKRAMDLVYKESEKGGSVYTLGPLIHNEQVVEDLRKKGVIVINSPDECADIKRGTVIIRSHGVSEDMIRRLEHYNMNIVDATCPFVAKIHRIVQEKYREGYQIIIIGSRTHPEVEGINGWCSHSAAILETLEEAERFCPAAGKKLCIVSQTTFNYKKFKDIVAIFEKKSYDVIVMNTICNATEERQTEASTIARRSDAMLVIGGKHSSNTQKLYEICKRECPDTYFIQTLDDLDLELFQSFRSVGITAGASTPNNIIKEVQSYVRCEQ